jgi:hypothetical protein
MGKHRRRRLTVIWNPSVVRGEQPGRRTTSLIVSGNDASTSGLASWRGGQLLSGKAATRAGGPNPIPHPTGWGLPFGRAGRIFATMGRALHR